MVTIKTLRRRFFSWPDASPARPSVSPCTHPGTGPGQTSSVAPWRDCAPCHFPPDADTGVSPVHQTAQLPDRVAPGRAISVSCCHLPCCSRPPRQLPTVNILWPWQPHPAPSNSIGVKGAQALSLSSHLWFDQYPFIPLVDSGLAERWFNGYR